MTTFVLNPYNTTLDLSRLDKRKLYTEVIKGLKEGNHFTGKKSEYDTFSKLMDKSFRDVQVMESPTILTVWDAINADNALKRIPSKAEVANIFTDNIIRKEQVKAKSELVWTEITFGANTPKCFKTLANLPVDDATLESERNRAKMKYIITAKNIWASLDAEF